MRSFFSSMSSARRKARYNDDDDDDDYDDQFDSADDSTESYEDSESGSDARSSSAPFHQDSRHSGSAGANFGGQQMPQFAPAVPTRDGGTGGQAPPLPPRTPAAHILQQPAQALRSSAIPALAAQRAGSEATHSIPRKPINKPEKRILIAVFGMTGTGKTSFIRTLAGEAASQLQIGHDLESCTQDIATVDFTLDGHEITIVDTPGFDDSKRSDTEILKRIAAWLKDSYNDESLLSGLIYLHRISDVRMTGSSIKNLRMFRKLCGADQMSKVCLVTTMWDKIEAQDGAARERDLKGAEYWGPMISNGSSIRRHDRGLDSARDVVLSMLDKKPAAIKLQEEMMIAGKNLIETDAGMAIDEEIRRLEKKHKEDLKELEEEMGTAMLQKNEQFQAQLRAEYAHTLSEIERRAKERQELAQAQIINLQRGFKNASRERDEMVRELSQSAAREHDLRIMSERKAQQVQLGFSERMARFEEASAAKARAEFARGQRERQRPEPRFETSAESSRGGYEERPHRGEVGRGRGDPPNTVNARRDSAPLQGYRITHAETKSTPRKYHGQPYKTFQCYVPNRNAFGSSGCGRPFDVVNPTQGGVRCCYCKKSWKIWGQGRLR